MTHFNRDLLVAFVYVNGLHFDVFFKWCEIIGSFRDRAARNHVIALHKLMSKGTERALYQYNRCSVLPGGLGSPGGHSFILLPIKSVGSQDTWLIKCWGVSGSWSSTPPVFLGHSGS